MRSLAAAVAASSSASAAPPSSFSVTATATATASAAACRRRVPGETGALRAPHASGSSLDARGWPLLDGRAGAEAADCCEEKDVSDAAESCEKRFMSRSVDDSLPSLPLRRRNASSLAEELSGSRSCSCSDVGRERDSPDPPAVCGRRLLSCTLAAEGGSDFVCALALALAFAIARAPVRPRTGSADLRSGGPSSTLSMPPDGVVERERQAPLSSVADFCAWERLKQQRESGSGFGEKGEGVRKCDTSTWKECNKGTRSHDTQRGRNGIETRVYRRTVQGKRSGNWRSTQASPNEGRGTTETTGKGEWWKRC